MQQYLIINRLYSVVCLLSSVVCPLHLSRILYKSALFMQNKPNFQKSQMNVSILSKMDYENKSYWTLGENKPKTNPIKPNFQKAQMIVSSLITKDYGKKDDFVVRINKPNFRNGQNERKLNFNKGLQKKRLFSIPKNKPNSNPIRQACVVCEGVAGLIKACPELAEALSAVEGAVEWANFLKAQMNVNSIITKDYRKYDEFSARNWDKCSLISSVRKGIKAHSGT
jgi:hypothetical protein